MVDVAWLSTSKTKGNLAETVVDGSKWFPLPTQYELHDTSGITTTIHHGDNTFDIDLK